MKLLTTLQEFGRKQTSPWHITRELIAHDGWFTPSTTRRNQLWLFTSEAELADARTRAPLEPYAGPVQGVALFEKLPTGLRTVEINPTLEPERGWFLAAGAIGLVRGIAQAVALDRARETNAPDLIDRLIAHERYTVLVDSFGRPAVALEEGGLRNPVMVLTAPDAIGPMLANNPELGQFTHQIVSGEQLWSQWPSLGSDGVVLYSRPDALAPWTLATDQCLGISRMRAAQASAR